MICLLGWNSESGSWDSALAENILRAWGAWNFVIDIITSTIIFYFGLMHFTNLRALKTAVKTYDVRNAQLANENDRELLLRHIDDLFYEEASESEVLGIDLFNKAVRDQVPLCVTLSGFRSWTVLS